MWCLWMGIPNIPEVYKPFPYSFQPWAKSHPLSPLCSCPCPGALPGAQLLLPRVLAAGGLRALGDVLLFHRRFSLSVIPPCPYPSSDRGCGSSCFTLPCCAQGRGHFLSAVTIQSLLFQPLIPVKMGFLSKTLFLGKREPTNEPHQDSFLLL